MIFTDKTYEEQKVIDASKHGHLHFMFIHSKNNNILSIVQEDGRNLKGTTCMSKVKKRIVYKNTPPEDFSMKPVGVYPKTVF